MTGQGGCWVSGQTRQVPGDPLLGSLLQRLTSSSRKRTGHPKMPQLTMWALGAGWWGHKRPVPLCSTWSLTAPTRRVGYTRLFTAIEKAEAWMLREGSEAMQHHFCILSTKARLKTSQTGGLGRQPLPLYGRISTVPQQRAWMPGGQVLLEPHNLKSICHVLTHPKPKLCIHPGHPLQTPACH